MYQKSTISRIRQGDVFSNLQFRYVNDDETTDSIPFDFWVVMTQDCDLEQDFKSQNGEYKDSDKSIQTILACPAFISDQLKNGVHMQPLVMEKWSSDLWGGIKRNSHSRFHHLPPSSEFDLPELIIDFKRFFTLPRTYVYSNLDNRLLTINDLFRESLSQRFAYYLSRVALPKK